MPEPHFLAVHLQRRSDQAVFAEQHDCLFVSDRQQFFSQEFARLPQVVILQLSAGEFEQVLTAVVQLQSQWPLAKILVWAPQATGKMVRELLRAGAEDVVLSRPVQKLAEEVRLHLPVDDGASSEERFAARGENGTRFESLWSRSEKMWELFDLCKRIAPTEATVLIVGETGTGKELLARAVHRRSGRTGRFVAANCASIPRDLINSELFGYEKGAFTGADRSKKGLAMYAQGGTLLLDEVGDMPEETQLSLLRMLQEKRIRPLGSQFERKLEVRIVAATNIALDRAVRSGDFREDLFYRLDVIRMNVPPLRERREDILFLFGHFIKRLVKQYRLNTPTFSDSFLDAMANYDWPGNVRQLENFVERLVLARPSRVLTGEDFLKFRGNDQTAESRAQPPSPRRSPVELDLARTLEENLDPVVQRLERQYLHSILKQTRGRIAEAAQKAGISRRTLLRKMKIYNIDKQQYKE